MEHSPEKPVIVAPDSRLTIAYGSHFALGLVVLGAIILQAAISINDWANAEIETLVEGHYDNLADGLSGLYRFVSIWPLVGAIFGIGRTLGDIPRDMRLGLLLFLMLMIMIMGMLSLGPLVGFFAVVYMITSLYLGGKWLFVVVRTHLRQQRQTAR